MLKVFKYEVSVDFTLNLPKGAKPLAIQNQHGAVYLWALVDPSEPFSPRHFRLVGTGHLIEDNMDDLTYIGTVQMDNGNLIFHLFEKEDRCLTTEQMTG